MSRGSPSWCTTPDRAVVGVGRWIRSRAEQRTAEIGVTVVDAYQGLGLGRMLLPLDHDRQSVLGELLRHLRLPPKQVWAEVCQNKPAAVQPGAVLP